ncbi:MAG: group 1 truncated hemoglobin [Alphaproteobacteria bacterium]|nr:group 1 truncated hemoglobin [Alphaproteobacteria bacterium]
MIGRWALVVAMGLGLAACAEMSEKKEIASLFNRLGGKEAIVAVVDDFVGNVAADERINGFFGNTDIPALKANLVDQVCQASGGPCTYTGRDMKTTHAGMGINKDQFNAMGEDMLKTLAKFNVPEQETNEVMSLLGSVQGDIVGQYG